MTAPELPPELSAGARAVLAAVAAAAEGCGAATALVGGALRDLFLGAPSPRDLDVVVAGGAGAVDALVAALRLRPGLQVKLRHERFGTVSLSAPGNLNLDLAMARFEEYPTPGGLPVVRPAPAIGDDLARRDFTVHALAAPVLPGGGLGEVLDPFDGRRDLADRTLRLLHPDSLSDDPTRALRAAAYAAALGFAPAGGFEEALERSRRAGSWGNVSGDRLRRGLELILSQPSAPRAVALLRSWGILDDIVPGWGTSGAALTGPASWGSFLRVLDRGLRDAIAARLSFSRKQRREAVA